MVQRVAGFKAQLRFRQMKMKMKTGRELKQSSASHCFCPDLDFKGFDSRTFPAGVCALKECSQGLRRKFESKLRTL